MPKRLVFCRTKWKTAIRKGKWTELFILWLSWLVEWTSVAHTPTIHISIWIAMNLHLRVEKHKLISIELSRLKNEAKGFKIVWRLSINTFPIFFALFMTSRVWLILFVSIYFSFNANCIKNWNSKSSPYFGYTSVLTQ